MEEAMTDSPSITCAVCGMKSYNPHDIRWGYCGNCQTFTGEKLAGTPNPEWQDNPVVTDKPIIRHGPTRPPIPTFWDWFIRACFVAAALIALGYVLYALVIT